MTLQRAISRFLETNTGRHKARAIARALGRDVSDVNSELYRGLGRFFTRNKNFEWQLLATIRPGSSFPAGGSTPTATIFAMSDDAVRDKPQAYSQSASVTSGVSVIAPDQPFKAIPRASESERRGALAIFRYLRDLALLRSAVVRDLRTYERCFWLDSIRGREGCMARCFREEDQSGIAGSDSENEDVWLSVQKLPEPTVPAIPTRIRRWIDPDSGRHADCPPRLLDRIKLAPPEDWSDSPNPSAGKGPDFQDDSPKGAATQSHKGERYELLEDHPDVAVALNDFMQAKWRPWAAKYSEWVEFQENVYAPLFVIHRDLKRLGEEFELVLGIGCLTWKATGGQTVRRHLITAQVALEFDPASGIFVLRPGSDGAKLSLEVDMLDPNEQPTIAQRDVISSDLTKADDDPWNFEAVDRALRGFTQAIKEDGTYDPWGYGPKSVERVPQTAFAPALLLRRRTSRGILQTFDEIIKQIEAGDDIPPGVRRLTRAAPAEVGPEAASGPPTRASLNTISRVYFPLPANEDQRDIVERLDGRHGVLVQGPPGTGKSHTIANLICHLLATGQRVLITAQTPRALQVLRDKLPAEIRPLCLSVLGNDKAAHDNVEDSVRNITDKADSWHSSTAEDEIRKAEADLDRLAQREAALEGEVRRFREAEVHEHTIAEGAYSGTAQVIAQKVRENADRFAWFTDSADPDTSAPIDADALSTYLVGLKRIGPERAAETEQRRPVRGTEIPTDDTLIRFLRASRKLQSRLQPLADDEQSLAAKPLDDLRRAYSALRSLNATLAQVPLAAGPWVATALNDSLNSRSGRWELICTQTRSAGAELEATVSKISKLDVRVPPERPSDSLLADVSDLYAHLQGGGRLGFLFFRARVVRHTLYLTREAAVDGRPCENIERLGTLKVYLECSAGLARLWKLWAGMASPSGQTQAQQVEELHALSETLKQVLAIRPLAEAATTSLVALNVCDPPALGDRSAVDGMCAKLERVIVRREYQVVKSQLDARSQALRTVAALPNAHPVCARMADALERREEAAFAAAIAEMESLENDAALLAEWARLDQRISGVLPNLARSIAATHADPAWKARIADWKGAWRWAQADAWLAKYTDPRKAAAVEVDLRLVKDRIKACLVRASAERAWHSCLAGMSEEKRDRLHGWRNATAKITKTGRGKRDAYFKRVAQNELERCREAIPAWVMPLYKVFETVRPTPCAFDVVVVDEASQCGPEALVLFYLGKKVIVVGDDEQISPSNVGVDREDALRLLRQHLADLEQPHIFDIDNSLFEHGKRLGKVVTLREHFRCMPEIIRFSNDLCYRGSLIPLRQYPPNRLAPFVARRVHGSKREGGDRSPINRAEADAVVEAIATCCKDPAYADKTMGVVSLLGEHQAKLVERLLLKRLGAEEIDRRRIVCGDAYAFQGDERHVIFLSMVVAVRGDDSKGFAPLVKKDAKQRFNVAASRAQDQLWLVHSVMPEDIANEECMRRKLLTYFYDPARHAAAAVGVDLANLRAQAGNPDRPAMAPAPFDSWFEVDVYLRIADRGFRVIPQYKAGRKRIDLVVEGRTRLAIECDGDRFHTDENFDEDMARQRQLERANWRFWRVRGSAFYRDPEAALGSLWQRLAELGIEPMPAVDGSGSGDGYIPDIPGWANRAPITEQAESPTETAQASDTEAATSVPPTE